eukprot:COSAG06_NODE_7445_length_2501_cov_1.228464_2_plen_371_part_00
MQSNFHNAKHSSNFLPTFRAGSNELAAPETPAAAAAGVEEDLPAELDVIKLPPVTRERDALLAASKHPYIGLVPVVSALPSQQAQCELVQRLRLGRYEADEPVTTQGEESGGELYILLRGLLKVTVDGKDRWWLKPGASFGGAGIGARPWAATVVADGGDVAVAVLVGDDVALANQQRPLTTGKHDPASTLGMLGVSGGSSSRRKVETYGTRTVLPPVWPHPHVSPKATRRRGEDPNRHVRRSLTVTGGLAAGLSLDQQIGQTLPWSAREAVSRVALRSNGARPIGYGGFLGTRPPPGRQPAGSPRVHVVRQQPGSSSRQAPLTPRSKLDRLRHASPRTQVAVASATYNFVSGSSMSDAQQRWSQRGFAR